MRSWKMPSRAAFDIDILVMAAPEYLDIVSRGRRPPVFCRERGGITGPETIRPDRILPEGLWLFAVLGFPRAIDLIVGVRWMTARFSYRSCRDYVPIHGGGVDHPRFRRAFPESRLLTGAGFVLLARLASRRARTQSTSGRRVVAHRRRPLNIL